MTIKMIGMCDQNAPAELDPWTVIKTLTVAVLILTVLESVQEVSLIFGPGTDTISLLMFLLLGQRSSKKPKAFRFKSDQDESWLDCSSSKYASIDGDRFLRMAAMTSARRSLLHMH